MSVCIVVIMEVLYNILDDFKKYWVEVEFIIVDEWVKEFDIFFDDIYNG